MAADSFYVADPTERASWRLAVLMGANSRTYKFALAEALLGFAEEGREDVTLAEFAVPYSLGLVRHQLHTPQASSAVEETPTDFLVIAREEAEETLRLGHPTERLSAAAQRSMPAMVMQRFHNLKGGSEVPHRFYDLQGTGQRRTVVLTPELRRLAASEQAPVLRDELAARWRIVESCFAAGIGRGVVQAGLSVDRDAGVLLDRQRRRSVAGVVEGVIGFQHGRCLICWMPILSKESAVVDHVFPLAFMRRLAGVNAWHGPDLDALWNLAAAHARCNSDKSAELPGSALLLRLAARNAAIRRSPKRLRDTLALSLGRSVGDGSTAQWMRLFREIAAL
ncbi:HNH endonuclease [Streptomyces sp. NPDC088360]|uniref:HNH endonuclease n=1 Tax=Streptomyces sp. NPDC088360 TaxID=3154515 RepID=UPI003450A587